MKNSTMFYRITSNCLKFRLGQL